MKAVIQNGDLAIGYLDILGNPVTGTISSNSKLTVFSIPISVTGDIVHFPLHPTALDGMGHPTNYIESFIPIVGTGTKTIQGKTMVLNGDTVPGMGAAIMVASQNKLFSN